MNETKKTIIFGGAALILLLLAMITAPGKVTPNAFLDQGEQFFPQFQDPNTAASLEVINYDQETGETIPFKVVFEEGKWSIPSHHNYPADGKDRLAKTAAGVIGIKKDDFRSDNPADHAACGVVDPLDESAGSLEGRGQRVTIKGANEIVLADFIIGKKIEGREGFRFVRVPGQKRVYAVRMDIDVSTKFSDWIESDLLNIEKGDIIQMTLKDYSFNERTRKVRTRDVLKLTESGGEWKANKMAASQKVDKTKMDELLKNVDELSIVGVRPKPEGLSRSLKKTKGGIEITMADYRSLQSKGFDFGPDGSLVSNEGELQVKSKNGVVYTLRFGEVVYGSGFDLSAGTEQESQSGSAENRYMFISTHFDAKIFKEPKKPRNTDFLNSPDSLWSAADKANKELHEAHEQWQKNITDGKKRSEDLNDRFADWYYVISDASYKKLRLKRSDLLVKNTD